MIRTDEVLRLIWFRDHDNRMLPRGKKIRQTEHSIIDMSKEQDWIFERCLAILFVIWSYPGDFLGRSLLWIIETISKIDFAGRDMGKGEDKNELD